MTTLLPAKFGPYGGQFVPETLMPALIELEAAFVSSREDREFQAEFDRLMATFVGRPTPITHVKRLSEKLGGAQIYLKREDLAHTGAHKINNALGQALLARQMGKTRVIAETGAGQHGVASATAAALLGLECVVYMGSVDIERQKPNVHRMQLLGAEVRPVNSGTRTLKDAINEAIRDWVANVRDTHYLLGSALGPHPYPTMVREFQSVIGREARAQMLADAGRLPDTVIACVGGGSNAIGIFSAFIDDEAVELIGVEAAGAGISTGLHAARFGDPSKGARGCDPRHADDGAAGRGRSDRRHAFHLGRAGLRRGRAGARPTARHGTRLLHICHRRRDHARFLVAVQDRGDHPRARVVACRGRGDQARPENAQRPGGAGQPLRPGRQRPRHRPQRKQPVQPVNRVITGYKHEQN